MRGFEIHSFIASKYYVKTGQQLYTSINRSLASRQAGSRQAGRQAGKQSVSQSSRQAVSFLHTVCSVCDGDVPVGLCPVVPEDDVVDADEGSVHAVLLTQLGEPAPPPQDG